MNIPASSGSAANAASSASSPGGTGLASAMRVTSGPRSCVGRDRAAIVTAVAIGPTLQFARDLRERNDGIRNARVDDQAAHLPHDARRFVLDEDAAAGAGDLLAAPQSVLAHAGQHDTEAARPERRGNRLEEHVGRRTMRVLGRILIEDRDGAARGFPDGQVVVAWRDVDDARLNRLAVDGF